MLGYFIRRNAKGLQNLLGSRPGRALGVIRKLRGYAPNPPLFVEMSLTRRCNARCSYCYQSWDSRAAYPDMTFEDACAYGRNLRESFRFRPRILLIGGEPTLNRDFDRIVRHLSGHGHPLMLTTNGMNLGQHLDALLSAKTMESVVVSVNPYNLESTPKVLAELSQGRRRLRAGVSVNVPVGVARELGLRLADIVRRFEDCDVRVLCFQHAMDPSSAGRDPDAADLADQIRQVRSGSFRIPVTFRPDIRAAGLAAFLTDPAYPGPEFKCLLPWLAVFVYPNGDVTPCDEIPEVLGNLRTASLAQIWNGAALRAFRQGIERRGVPHEICRRCCHRQYP